MREENQIIYMQVRMLRLAAERWQMSISQACALFDRYGVFNFIRDCFGVFHMEGDEAVFYEIGTLLKNKGAEIDAAAL